LSFNNVDASIRKDLSGNIDFNKRNGNLSDREEIFDKEL
jgi:hypothetical protein